MKQQRAAAPATRPRPTRSKTLPSGSFINRIEHDALGQHTASTSVFDWLDLSLSSPLTFANIFRCLIFEAESELEALELESDWDSAEDEDEQVSTLLKSNKHRSTSLHALADSPSPEAEFAALKQFLIQSRAYISTLKTIMLANLPSSSEPLRDRFAKSSSAAPGPPSFGRLFVTLSSMHDMLNSIIDNTSTTLGSAPTTWKDTMSTSFDPLRSATAIFLSKLPEPPSLPLARLRASLAADSEWLANTLASLGPYSPSAGRRRFSLFAGSLSSQASDLVGQAGDKVREEGHKLKEAFVEEKERLGQLLGEEAEKFKRALHQGANRLLSYDDLPFLWQNNEYIRSGYRFIPIERWRELLLSTFQLHNETLNIWTHLIGAASVCWLLYSLHPLSSISLSEYALDRIVSLSFLTCALCCLLFSSLWHLMAGCATINLFNSSACLDYVGVSALICSSIFTMIWYGFYCRPDLLKIYATAAFAVGVAGVILPWSAWFNQRKNKNWRIAFFLSMCLSAIVPQCHMAAIYGLRETLVFYAPVLMSAMAYVVGLIFYGFNFPERLRPGGLFDTLLHSHQFWHVAIVVAIWLQYYALNVMHTAGTEGFSCDIKPHPGVAQRLHVES